MKTINVPFTKVFYSRTNYALTQISNWILGKSESTLQAYKKSDQNYQELCGFYLPPFQRGEVWKKPRQIKLIESLFCEINIGTLVYVSNYDCPQIDGWLIDGQQRLCAIRDFVLGKFKVFDGELSYENMSEVNLAFNGEDNLNKQKPANVLWKRLDLEFLRIENVTDVEILKSLYVRMNFGGINHKKKDIPN